MTQETANLQISANQSDHLITIQMVTRYGPIAFSYSPKEIDLGIANLVRVLLRDTADPTAPLLDLEISDSTQQQLMKSAEVYHEHDGKKFPMDAIERFSQTRGYSQGTVEQVIDNLPAAISLMMDYVAIAALTLDQTNESSQSNLTVEEKRKSLRRRLRDLFIEGPLDDRASPSK